MSEYTVRVPFSGIKTASDLKDSLNILQESKTKQNKQKQQKNICKFQGAGAIVDKTDPTEKKKKKGTCAVILNYFCLKKK